MRNTLQASEMSGSSTALKATAILLMVTIVIYPNDNNQAEATKVDCHPINGATKEKCEALGCVWSPVKSSGTNGEESRVGEPWCFFPKNYQGYKLVSKDKEKEIANLQRIRPSAIGNDVQNITVRVRRAGKGGNVRRFSFEDSNKERFQPDIPELDQGEEVSLSDSESPISLEWISSQDSGKQLKVLVKQAGSREAAFGLTIDVDTMIYSDQYLQINCDLAQRSVYGLGEHYGPFRKMVDSYKVYSFYNTDRLPSPGGTRSYGGLPFFINFDQLQSTVLGIYVRTSNAMDVVFKPESSMEFRVLGGILDIYMFVGPNPLDVVRQFQTFVGLPDLPPRWALGFHLCRYDYKSLEKTKTVWKRTREAGIPFDVQWNDLDYMDKSNDFTYNPKTYAGLPEFVDELHSKHMHYIPLIDPGISQEDNYYAYELGTQMDIWVKNATNQTLVGKVWNQSGRTVFPDFSNPKSHEYWAKVFVDFHEKVKFDGAWIDMNDISNFVDGSLDGCPWNDPLENPPYLPGGFSLQRKSLCLTARYKAGREYDLHNLYSFYEAIATKKALEAARPGQRTLIISRSTHLGQGHYSGHWSGDVLSNWDYLRWSIPSLLEHSMFGFSMMGSDICGFTGNTTPELCARWSTLGAFYTFSRNHNDEISIDQDPVALGADVVEANKNAFTKRYSLLPYLYTLVYNAHKTGQPAVRSVAFEFFESDGGKSIEVEDQFMFGSAIMISPVLLENTYAKRTYLPKGRWYETNILPESNSFDIAKVAVPKVVDLTAAADDGWHSTSNISLANMPIFYRGGHIIPVYEKVGRTIYETEHEQPIALEVAFGGVQTARGELVLDDGESTKDETNYLKFAADDKLGMLNILLVRDDYKKRVEFGKVKLLGVGNAIKIVEVISSGKRRPVPFAQSEHLVIFDLGASSVTKGEQLSIRWSS